MTTVRDIIGGAFEAIRVYAPGEPMSDPDAARGFIAINQMIDSWSNESLTCYAILEQSAALQVAKSQYTIGPQVFADLVMPRPIRIITGPGAAYLLDSNNNRYPVDVLSRDEWNLIWNLLSVNSNLPNTIFYDPQFPLGVINVFPQPNMGGVTLYWDSYLQLAEFPEIDATLSFPPGYERAIQQNLSLELEPYYPTAVVTPQLMRSAMESKGNIKRSNTRPVKALYDKELLRGQRVYNIYSDTYR